MGATDLRFYFDIMGAYYLPERDKEQQIVLKKNPSALPYLFIPAKIYFTRDFPLALKELRNPLFRSNHDAILANGSENSPLEQIEERGNFLINKRDGRSIDFEYTPQHSSREKYLVLNESYDENWRVYINGQKNRPLLANGWANGIKLENVVAGEPIHIIFRYENIYIWIGAILTGLWFAIFLYVLVIDKKRAA
jgi:hypothetical protein